VFGVSCNKARLSNLVLDNAIDSRTIRIPRAVGSTTVFEPLDVSVQLLNFDGDTKADLLVTNNPVGRVWESKSPNFTYGFVFLGTDIASIPSSTTGCASTSEYCHSTARYRIL